LWHYITINIEASKQAKEFKYITIFQRLKSVYTFSISFTASKASATIKSAVEESSSLLIYPLNTPTHPISASSADFIVTDVFEAVKLIEKV